jgi:hypothetical protein
MGELDAQALLRANEVLTARLVELVAVAEPMANELESWTVGAYLTHPAAARRSREVLARWRRARGQWV